MLQGEAGSDVQDINAKTPPPGQDWYYAGPHVMLVLPDGDRDALKDVGQQAGVTVGSRTYLEWIPHRWAAPPSSQTARIYRDLSR
jgi:hypothetical protein